MNLSLSSMVPPVCGTLEGDDLIAQGMSPELVKESERKHKEISKHISPPGSLGLNDLLDERRLQIGLPDQCFLQKAVYNRLLIWQMDPLEFAGGTAGTSGLYVPEKTMDRESKQAPRALIVSAGVDALDILRCHGMDVGHIVTMIREAPFGIRVAIIAGEHFSLTILDAGDICASEDLGVEMLSGRCESFYDDVEHVHKLRDPRTGEAWSPEHLFEERAKVTDALKAGKKKGKKKAAAKKTTAKKTTARKGRASKGRVRRSPRVVQGF